jgi:uncharacterized repeat protein (TIGR02543 family)
MTRFKMKFKLNLLLAILTMVTLSTCQNKDINADAFKIERERVVPSVSSVSVTGSYSFAGTVKGMKMNVGEKESLIDAVSHEMQLQGTDFSVVVENLTPNTEYYYCYSVDFGAGESLLTETSSFKTREAEAEAPTVKIYQYPLFNEDSTFVRVKCEVVADGGSTVTERGIFWNNLGDPVEGDSVLQHANGGLGIYTINMEHLSLGKAYYVRAYAKNAAGIGLSDDILEIKTNAQLGTSVNIEVGCNPEEGGSVTGGGTYDVGSQCTVTAEAKPGYTFVNWTENGNQVSSEAAYTFTVTAGRHVVANFTMQAYVITAEVTPDNSGTVTGAGGFNNGEECTLVATPKNGYDFVKWTKGGNTVSTQAEYTFTVNASATCVAHFQKKSYTVSVSADPNNGGSVEGGGTFNHGQSCTVHATPAQGYFFTSWTDNGDEVSTDADYTFAVTGNRSLVAHFAAQQVEEYTIRVSAHPAAGGFAYIGDTQGTIQSTFSSGQTCMVHAVASPGYQFTHWTENGEEVSIFASFSFHVASNRELVAHFACRYTITTQVLPADAGTVTGGGTYDYGETVTLTANANPGYTFSNWTQNGSVVSTNASYTITVTGDRTLTANFDIQGSIDFAAWVSITVLMGDGYSPEGATVTFLNHNSQAQQSYPVASIVLDETGYYSWDEFCVGNYQVTVSKAGYETIVDEVGIWEDNFSLSYMMTPIGSGNAPQGAINGRFTINSNGDQVYFSQGNLQYRASTNTWRFATNQYDYIGEANNNISSTYNGWIDLFGWGTSGWNSGNTYYHPWDSDRNNGSLYGPPGQNYIGGSYANADWGVYNAISNGGNQVGLWRTLTNFEWAYVFNTRNTTSGIRYAMAKVNNVNGVILLPDDWNSSYYTLSETNTNNASYSSNTISSSQWNRLEQHGAVFLPTAGFREGTSVTRVGMSGVYWHAVAYSIQYAFCVWFSDSGLYELSENRSSGASVRLVHLAQ